MGRTARAAARRRIGAVEHVQADAGEGAAVCRGQEERAGSRIQSGRRRRTVQRREARPRAAAEIQPHGPPAGRFVHFGKSAAGNTTFKKKYIYIFYIFTKSPNTTNVLLITRLNDAAPRIYSLHHRDRQNKIQKLP